VCQRCTTRGSACRPRIEIRVAVPEDELAVADAVVSVIRDALSPECVFISAVVRSSHNLTGPFPSLLSAATVRFHEMTELVPHPAFSCDVLKVLCPTLTPTRASMRAPCLEVLAVLSVVVVQLLLLLLLLLLLQLRLSPAMSMRLQVSVVPLRVLPRLAYAFSFLCVLQKSFYRTSARR
jgi:hypothetical protein